MADNKKKQKLSLGRTVQNTFFVLRYYFRYMPFTTAFNLLLSITTQVFWRTGYVLLFKILFDAIAAGEGLRKALLFLIGFGVVDFLLTLISDLFWGYIYNPNVSRMMKKVERELYEKAISMDLACFEDPEFYNDYMMALDSTNQKFSQMYFSVSRLISNLIAIFAIFAILATINPLFLLFPIVGSVLAIFISVKDNKVNFEYKKGRKPLERRRDYYGRVFYQPEYAKELRLSGITEHLLSLFDDAAANLRKYDRGYALKQATLQFLKNFVVYEFIAKLVMTAFCIYQVLVTKSVTVGEAAGLINAAQQTTYAVTNLVWGLAEFQDNAQYIECMRKFLDYEPKIVGGTLPAPEGPAEIRAEGLTFAYPGSDKAVLDGIDLTIAPGERVALVGYNGAGKTTLIKLLLRLYDPTEGRILLNGHDLREYDITSLREYFGCVFQDFVLFAATLGENVACDFMENSDPEKIRAALDLAGFSERLSQMEKGIDTPLTREFDESGLNLSGGENQKVAMARTFAKPSGCIILDEPSAALDPISEYNLNESMNAAAAGRTVVYISHRLSTTRMADRICMMEQGRIIESGSHDSLMALGGKYAEMFESQASRYVGGENEAK